jgi:hypothetical protein
MPNHTTNIMTVSGPEKDLISFMNKVSHKNPDLLNYYKEKLEKDIASKKASLKEFPNNNNFIQMELKNNEEELKKILDSTWTEHLDFNGTVPMPHSLSINSPARNKEEQDIAEDNVKKYGHADWYGWCTSNDGWGTKWGAYDVKEPEVLNNCVIYRYQTAWSPPLPWIQKTSMLFPSLTFNIAAADEGGDYYLVYEYKNNTCTSQNDMEAHDWRMTHDPDYAELVSSIFDCGYDEGIKYASERGYIEYSMEEKLLKFIKDEDLPLFINFNWEQDSACKNFNERIKNLKSKVKRKKTKEKKTHD